MKLNNPRKVLVDLAATQVGIKETSKNHGAGIEKFWKDTTYLTGYADRQPYCAAFCCWIIAEALRKGYDLGLDFKTRPKSAAVKDWIPWAKRSTSGALVFPHNHKVYTPEAGDFVIFTFSHMGIVEKGGVASIYTIEANTNEAGSREGNGIYRKVRPQRLINSYIRIAWKAQPA